MIDILLTTLPIYLLILLGFGAVRGGYVQQEHMGALSQFALRICLPALIFMAVAVPTEASAFNWAFMLGYLVASLAVMLIGFGLMRWGFGQTASLSWIFGLGMSNSNSGFMGFPIASLVFGPEAATVFAMALVIENTVMIPFASVAAAAAAPSDGDFRGLVRASVRNAASNPMLIAVAVALAARGLAIPVPSPIERTLSMLAGVAPTVALFVVGGTVAHLALSAHWRRSAAITAGKLVVHPLMVAVALSLLPGIPDRMAAIGIVFAAVPMLSIFPLLGQPYGGAQVCATSLIASTTLSFATVSALVALLT